MSATRSYRRRMLRGILDGSAPGCKRQVPKKHLAQAVKQAYDRLRKAERLAKRYGNFSRHD